MNVGRLILVALAWWSITARAADPFENWTTDLGPQDSIPFEFEATSRTVAIGDLHADPDAFLTLLQGTNLIDSHGHWTGGDTRLVVLGDIVSRGWNSRFIFDLLSELEVQAEKAGGGVHVLLGNHEQMKVMDSFERDYAERERFQYWDLIPQLTEEDVRNEIRIFQSALGPLSSEGLHQLRSRMLGQHGDRAYRAAFTDWNSPYLRAIHQRNTYIMVGDTLFGHAGFSRWLRGQERSVLGEINATHRAFLKESTRFVNRERLTEPHHWVTHHDGPVWTRQLADKKLSQGEVDHALWGVQARRVVFGHTWRKDGVIEASYDDKAWNIDTGISGAYAGKICALELKPGDPPRRLKYLRYLGAHPWREDIERRFARNHHPLTALEIDFQRVALSCSGSLAQEGGPDEKDP